MTGMWVEGAQERIAERGVRDLARSMERLAGLLAGASELDWPGVIGAACDEIEDLRKHNAGELPSPVVRWVRSVVRGVR